jgi:hypothetical protein
VLRLLLVPLPQPADCRSLARLNGSLALVHHGAVVSCSERDGNRGWTSTVVVVVVTGAALLVHIVLVCWRHNEYLRVSGQWVRRHGTLRLSATVRCLQGPVVGC